MKHQLGIFATVLCCVCVAMARGASPDDASRLKLTMNVLTTTSPTTLSYEDDDVREARGMSMLDYDHDDYDQDHDEHHVEEMMKAEPTEEPKAVKNDPWAGYYDFLINEGSFKFWAVFQLATAVLLIYSAFAAVYYAKFNPLTSDYDYYDDFFRRRSSARSAAAASSSSAASWLGMDATTFQRIIDAIATKKYA